MKTEIETNKGKIQAEIIRDNQQIQLNVFHTPKGFGFFLIYPSDQYQKMMESAKSLIEGDMDFDPDMDITSHVEGCLLAGTAPKMQFKAAIFGNPSICNQ